MNFIYEIIIRVIFVFNSHNLWSWLIDDDITFQKRLFVWHERVIIHSSAEWKSKSSVKSKNDGILNHFKQRNFFCELFNTSRKFLLYEKEKEKIYYISSYYNNQIYHWIYTLG